MATVNETIYTGRKFRKLIDRVGHVWARYSFWSKAGDTECNDGQTVETKVGAVKGITTDLNTTQVGYAADMTTVAELNNNIVEISNNLNSIDNDYDILYNERKTTIGNVTLSKPINDYKKLIIISGTNNSSNANPQTIPVSIFKYLSQNYTNVAFNFNTVDGIVQNIYLKYVDDNTVQLVARDNNGALISIIGVK